MISTMSSMDQFSQAALEPVSLEPYRSPDIFELERERVFRRAWLMIGRVEEVPKRGDYVVKTVEVLEASVIVVRGKDEIVRAFYNVCPHRGNQVVWDDKGSAPAFVCRYHNWSFSTDGTLRGIPDQESFPGLDKAKCGLPPVHLEIWDGWIFLNFARQPAMSLSEFLGPMADMFSGLDYTHAAEPVVIRTELQCNWKIVLDAFAEAYHIPAIHSLSLKPKFANAENPFGRPLHIEMHGLHGVNSMFGNGDYQPQDHQLVEQMAFDPKHRSEAAQAAAQRFNLHPAVNPTKTANWSMDVNYLFPNTHLDTNPAGFFTHQFWPLDVNRTRHETRFYVGRPTNMRERLAVEHRMALAVDVILEDLSNVERTQKGINSRGTDVMNLSESEALIRHSNAQLSRWVEAELSATGAELCGGR